MRESEMTILDEIIRSGEHGPAEDVRETIREIAPHLALVANLPKDWRAAAGLGSRTGSDHLGPSEHLREWQMGRVERIYASDPMIPGAPYARIKSEIMDRHPRGDWYKLPPEFDQRERGPGIAHIEPELTFERHFAQVDRRTDEPVWRLSGERVDATVAKDLRGIRHWCERGPGIVNVRGIEPRPVATVGYDDPTGDDVAADWRRS